MVVPSDPPRAESEAEFNTGRLARIWGGKAGHRHAPPLRVLAYKRGSLRFALRLRPLYSGDILDTLPSGEFAGPARPELGDPIWAIGRQNGV